MIEETFTDMYPIMRANFFGRDGLGLKVVATRGAGFAWRDEDPGACSQSPGSNKSGRETTTASSESLSTTRMTFEQHLHCDNG